MLHAARKNPKRKRPSLNIRQAAAQVSSTRTRLSLLLLADILRQAAAQMSSPRTRLSLLPLADIRQVAS